MVLSFENSKNAISIVVDGFRFKFVAQRLDSTCVVVYIDLSSCRYILLLKDHRKKKCVKQWITAET